MGYVDEEVVEDDGLDVVTVAVEVYAVVCALDGGVCGVGEEGGGVEEPVVAGRQRALLREVEERDFLGVSEAGAGRLGEVGADSDEGGGESL